MRERELEPRPRRVGAPGDPAPRQDLLVPTARPGDYDRSAPGDPRQQPLKILPRQLADLDEQFARWNRPALEALIRSKRDAELPRR